MARLCINEANSSLESANPRDRDLFLHWWAHSASTQGPCSISEAKQSVFAAMPFGFSSKIKQEPERYTVEVRLSSAVLPGQRHDYADEDLGYDGLVESKRPFMVVQERWSCPASSVREGRVPRPPVVVDNESFAALSLLECSLYDNLGKQRVGEPARYAITGTGDVVQENSIGGGMVIGFTAPLATTKRKKVKKAEGRK